ncbi:NADPH-dependent F420 reductase [Streptomyces sp. NBC_00996]|uniref:NADPH-dependent F420 reductase n=1 Tax=Streptomyces sp. NBC_00996 TaxID=2903710 RepID=UPI0038689D04|nr:NAD(P)-binding domain-containing protein [Streptomyces sp. NBC_00996]
MRIGILGTGGMADALGTRWARAGHEVCVGGRDLERAAGLARRLGGCGGDLRAAAEFGVDAVLLALPYAAVAEVVTGLRGALRDRVLIDCVNPLGPGFVLETAGGPSAAERLAAVAPDAHVVKAFNLCHEDVWRMTPPVFGGRPLAVPLCGDDEDALDVVRRLARDLGCEPLNAGELARAGLLEATAALLIGLWVGEGADAQAIAPPREFAGER